MARKSLLRGDTLPLISRLWRDWMRPHARTLALVLLLVILVAGATGLYPVLIKAAFDAFDAKDVNAIMLAPLFVIAVTSVKGFSLLALTVLTNKVVTRIEADMQTALYGHMIEADLSQIGRESPAAPHPGPPRAFFFHAGGADPPLHSVPARDDDPHGADRRHALDRPGADHRGGRDRAFLRLSGEQDRPA